MCPDNRHCSDIDLNERNCRSCTYFTRVDRAIDQLIRINESVRSNISLEHEVNRLEAHQGLPSVRGVCMQDYTRPKVVYRGYDISDCPNFKKIEKDNTRNICSRESPFSPYPEEMIGDSHDS